MHVSLKAVASLLPLLATPAFAQLRSITDFNYGWLFNYGDASGAQATTYDDGKWRSVNVPHDWAIEGPSPPSNPFSENATTLGRGGYVSAGVSWYRKHFSLEPASITGRNTYIEFDGVFEDATVYVNGKTIGTHIYGYTSFRYDISSAVTAGDNVVAVKTDTSRQPAERFYTGAGIYRDVRLISAAPVQVDQYGLYVYTTDVSTSSATVHAAVTVVNKQSTSASVSVHGTLANPSGPLSRVFLAHSAHATTAAKTLAAGESTVFNLTIPVSNPKLWDLDNPYLYNFTATVSVDGKDVDSDSSTLGIRSIVFSGTTGMSLNGKNVKFQGVCLHQDYHALGNAAPKRAMERRLKTLKSIGVNSIRTAHDPPSPAFLDLTDKLGFLVLDEFFDVWTKPKYTDYGDYSYYFNQNATQPYGGPAVPGATGNVPQYQVDVVNIVSRDRNHPSVALYSTGNEIHDSLATRTPYLTKMKALINTIDPQRAVTQALLDPGTAGDTTGATLNIVDVFGGNYHTSEVLTAMANSKKAGLITEQTTDTSNWTPIQQNTALTGLFLWTGVDYLGEALDMWPAVGATAGLVDAVGTIKASGYAWQKIWGGGKNASAATGTTASRIVLTSELDTVSTDVNDVAYVKAVVGDTSGRVVTGSSASITFSVSGPGVIVAVDSGSMTQSTFRGNVRAAYQGVAYVLVRATGDGVITVSATSDGLKDGKATLRGTTAPVVI